MNKELALCANVHDKEELGATLKCPMQLDQEWVIKLLKHLSLAQDRLDLIVIVDTVFAQNLDSIETSSIFLSGQDDPAEPATPDDAHLLEVRNRYVTARGQA